MSKKYIKTMEQLKKYLLQNETVEAVVYGTYEGEILGHEALKKGVLVATNLRLIFFHRGIFGITEEIQVFQYNKLTAINLKKTLIGDTVVFRVSGATAQLKWISEGDGLELVRVVHQKISNQ